MAESDFCTDFSMSSAIFDEQCSFFINNADFLEIGCGQMRRISPKFDKISRIYKPWFELMHTATAKSRVQLQHARWQGSKRISTTAAEPQAQLGTNNETSQSFKK
jgi:hypothetical protein